MSVDLNQTISEILNEVGDDPDLAADALDRERVGRNRVTLINTLEAIVEEGGDTPTPSAFGVDDVTLDGDDDEDDEDFEDEDEEEEEVEEEPEPEPEPAPAPAREEKAEPKSTPTPQKEKLEPEKTDKSSPIRRDSRGRPVHVGTFRTR